MAVIDARSYFAKRPPPAQMLRGSLRGLVSTRSWGELRSAISPTGDLKDVEELCPPFSELTPLRQLRQPLRYL